MRDNMNWPEALVSITVVVVIGFLYWTDNGW